MVVAVAVAVVVVEVAVSVAATKSGGVAIAFVPRGEVGRNQTVGFIGDGGEIYSIHLNQS